jgi:hypothetical protein
VLLGILAGKQFAIWLEAFHSSRRETIRELFPTEFDRQIQCAEFEVLLERTSQLKTP